MTDQDLSRREALRGGAAAALVGVGTALTLIAEGHDAHAQNMGDVNALNNLLRQEYQLQQAYDLATGYLMMPAMDDPQRLVGTAAATLTRHFRAQHADHAMRLTNLIRNFQGTPASESMEVFTPPSGFSRTVANFLRLACNREKAAAVAYTEALKTLSNATAAELVAGIAGVQTQRFIVLYLLLKQAIVPGMMFSEERVRQLFSATVVSAEGVPDASSFRGIAPYPYTM
jgi:hypothetical protein